MSPAMPPSVNLLLWVVAVFLASAALACLAWVWRLVVVPAWRGVRGLIGRRRRQRMREAGDPVVVRSRVLPEAKPFFKARNFL
jgi:hypothetical protein